MEKLFNICLIIALISFAYRGIIFKTDPIIEIQPVLAFEGLGERLIGPVPQKYKFDYYTVSEGDTFAVILDNFGIAYEDTLEVLKSAEGIYDWTNVGLGKILRIEQDRGDLNRIEYDLNSDEMLIVEKVEQGYKTSKQDIEYAEWEVKKNNSIESSLFAAGASVGMPDKAILELAEVFAWNIDFAVQVQKGDSFSALYNERSRNGIPASSGDVLAATFSTGGQTYKAYMFEVDGVKKYFDGEGNALVRQFLRAPLKYNRITSGFSYARFHPVLGKNTTHLAIDYAAPTGTPIRSVGDGSVVFAGWKTGYGNFINIRHNGTYRTQYAHLSRFAIKAGERVKQGDVIGYVGSTGFSTGPHLHYQIEKNGKLVDPLKLELPKGDPISEELKEAFLARKEELEQKLEE